MKINFFGVIINLFLVLMTVCLCAIWVRQLDCGNENYKFKCMFAMC